MKDDRKRDCEVLENKLRASEISKAEMSAREQSIREQIAQLKGEKDQVERELTDQLSE
jgi:hypothetical protein